MIVKIKKYIRDGRAPIPVKPITSAIMSRIRAKNTKPELLLRKALRKEGVKGFKLHYAKVPGRPDICFPKKKVGVFVNGCYWHRCPFCKLSMPKTHVSFWRTKFLRNRERDRRKVRELRRAGWMVVTLWECRIKANIEKQLARIGHLLLECQKNTGILRM